MRIGFVINPIAGMGGRVGLKGTDGMVELARELGAQPQAGQRAREALSELARLVHHGGDVRAAAAFQFVCAGGAMGADALEAAGFSRYERVYEPAAASSAADTRAAVERFCAHGVDLILFCGDDGTARDVFDAAGASTPLLGIPAGVKMFSGVFGTSPARTAQIVFAFERGQLQLARVEVADLDEAQYREGKWLVRRHGEALTPREPTFTQSSKELISGASDTQAKLEIARYLAEEIRSQPGTLFLLGPGSTLAALAQELSVSSTPLGIDALLDGKLIGLDLDEGGLLALLDTHTRCRLVLSPLGAQGFVLGRGNLQLSPRVIRRIGVENVIVVATPDKLARTPLLHFDTSDPELDRELCGAGYVKVVTGYRLRKMVRAAV
jgi:predicted polyphosphate/ATP-dependent NAD kinase